MISMICHVIVERFVDDIESPIILIKIVKLEFDSEYKLALKK